MKDSCRVFGVAENTAVLIQNDHFTVYLLPRQYAHFTASSSTDDEIRTIATVLYYYFLPLNYVQTFTDNVFIYRKSQAANAFH